MTPTLEISTVVLTLQHLPDGLQSHTRRSARSKAVLLKIRTPWRATLTCSRPVGVEMLSVGGDVIHVAVSRKSVSPILSELTHMDVIPRCGKFADAAGGQIH